MAIPEKIKDVANKIRKATYGGEVQESLAKGIEETGELANESNDRSKDLDAQFQNVIDETTGKDFTSAPEIIAARKSKPNLNARLEDFEQSATAQFQQTSTQLTDNAVEIRKVKANKADKTMTDALNEAKLTKGQPESVSWGMLDQTAKTNITGGSTPVVGVDSVNTVNVVDSSITSTKRTDIGDFGIISTNGIPDFDFNLNTLTIPKPAKIFHKKEMYTLDNGVDDVELSIDNTGYPLGVVVFNTTTSQLAIKNSDSIAKASENDIMIATFYNGTKEKKVNMIGMYTINGKPPFFKNEIDRIYLRHGNNHYKTTKDGTDIIFETTSTTMYFAFLDNSYFRTLIPTQYKNFTLSHNQCFVYSIKNREFRITTFGWSNRLNPLYDLVLFAAVDGNLSGKLLYNVIENQYLYQRANVPTPTKSVKKILSKDMTNMSAPNGITVVNDELWAFASSNYENTNDAICKRYSIDDISFKLTQTGEFQHNFGHVNSISYCEKTDTLVCGNGSGSYSLGGKIHLLYNASTYKEKEKVDINESGMIIDVSSMGWGAKLNAIWGEDNDGKNNIIYVITNDNKNIRRVMLGQGTNNLTNGTFVSGKTGLDFNGTYIVLDEYSQKDGDEVLQDAHFGSDGYLYLGLGHSGLWYVKVSLNEDGSISKEMTRTQFYEDNGEIIPSYTEGIVEYKDKLLVRLVKGSIWVYVVDK